ncbi:MAG: 23S rRNA (uracil(1939)-C(5))-methyltransferase RlmD [Ruminococcus sp.]|nr:23S rRNA (uracil(1939)-C(5))-methyltransferase RlmD [Ruminococcus sp.]
MDVNLNCKIAKKCNSCQLNNLNYEEQLKFKFNKCIKFLGSYNRIEPVIAMENPFSYRNKAQAVFKRERDKSISWGLYKSTTNTLVKTRECKLHTKHSNEIFNTLCALFKSFKIAPFDPFKGTGFIKSVVIREGFASGEVMVIINGADPIFPAKKTFVSALIKKHPYITTVVTTVNKDRRKLFTAKTQDVLFGDGYIKDTLCDKTFIISPQSFYQINPVQTKKLYEKAIELAQLNGTQTVLDAYCGVGTIGICACDKAKKVYAVESVKDAIIDAKKNAKINKISNINFVCADAKDYIETLKNENVNIDVAFVDPPRAGCSKEFLNSVIDMQIKTLVYISCNIETQSRDLHLLKQNGYKVEHIQPVDMFPHTNHIECIALIKKQ